MNRYSIHVQAMLSDDDAVQWEQIVNHMKGGKPAVRLSQGKVIRALMDLYLRKKLAQK